MNQTANAQAVLSPPAWPPITQLKGCARVNSNAHHPTRDEFTRRHKSNSGHSELKKKSRDTALPQPHQRPKHFINTAVKACQIGNSRGVGVPFTVKPSNIGRSRSMRSEER